MIRDEDLLEGLICYGRAPVQDLVTRSRNVEDAVRYLQTERNLQMAHLISFVTRDLRNFERRGKRSLIPASSFPRRNHEGSGVSPSYRRTGCDLLNP